MSCSVRFRQGAALAFILGLWTSGGCSGSPPGGSAARPLAVASIGPLADWARHVAGPAWDVGCVLPPGANTHSFELRPLQVRRFGVAKFWLRVGPSLDPWMDPLLEGVPPSRRFELCAGRPLLEGNPHLWVDPGVAREALAELAEDFARLDPGDSAGYRDRARAYTASVDSVDLEFREATRHFRLRRFVSFHEAWPYLARRYGLEQAGAIEPAPGREPGPGDWARLVRILKDSNARVVFSEPQFSGRLAEALARDAGVRVLSLDPEGRTADPHGETWVQLMRRNLAALREGLQ